MIGSKVNVFIRQVVFSELSRSIPFLLEKFCNGGVFSESTKSALSVPTLLKPVLKTDCAVIKLERLLYRIALDNNQ